MYYIHLLNHVDRLDGFHSKYNTATEAIAECDKLKIKAGVGKLNGKRFETIHLNYTPTCKVLAF